ncbi:MAG: hypothetical protein PHZ02_01355 [Desulfocapsaceae bacterium]|nr:hypothetical protein [Desulfocapsaceae bacterium]
MEPQESEQKVIDAMKALEIASDHLAKQNILVFKNEAQRISRGTFGWLVDLKGFTGFVFVKYDGIVVSVVNLEKGGK